MQKICTQCQAHFTVTQDDLDFHAKVSPVIQGQTHLIPPPTLCPDCREQRRLAFRNERTLYRRTCDLTGAPIIALFPPDSPYTVYSTEAWFSDGWDALSYGRDIDFSRPFFEQFDALLKVVPQSGSGFRNKCENCDYCNYQNDSRNCYLTFGSGFMEDCAYASWTYYAKDSYDTLGCSHVERCHELVDCSHMYGCSGCRDCSNLSDSTLCYECQNCRDCTGCVGLRQKQYCLFNEQLSKETYASTLATLSLDQIQERFNDLKRRSIHRERFMLNCEQSTGDHLWNCKNAQDCFYLTDAQDCTHCTTGLEMKDCRDCNRTGINELVLECVSGGRYTHCFSVVIGDYSHDNFYCYSCFNSQNMFGCISMRHKQYCILNKQYTKEEYEELVPRLIEHMRSTGEYGEFFPAAISPFSYNETIAQEYYPLEKEDTERRGWQWRQKQDEPLTVAKTIEVKMVPASIDTVPDDILNWAIVCEATGRPFKITKQELAFYRTSRLPVPHFHPDERHRRRMLLRNPRKLWNRDCMKCGKAMHTTYAPDRPETVYCEDCYLKEVY